jgi:hypothetical protein
MLKRSSDLIFFERSEIFQITSGLERYRCVKLKRCDLLPQGFGPTLKRGFEASTLTQCLNCASHVAAQRAGCILDADSEKGYGTNSDTIRQFPDGSSPQMFALENPQELRMRRQVS